MRPYRTVLLLILCFALPCIAQAQTPHLTAAEAKNHVGETATVCGRVASAHFAEKAKGLPTFMNLDMPYPQQIFTILIYFIGCAILPLTARDAEAASVNF
jgi:hypothetical protein